VIPLGERTDLPQSGRAGFVVLGGVTLGLFGGSPVIFDVGDPACHDGGVGARVERCAVAPVWCRTR
jgi:hypothetical protein